MGMSNAFSLWDDARTSLDRTCVAHHVPCDELWTCSLVSETMAPGSSLISLDAAVVVGGDGCKLTATPSCSPGSSLISVDAAVVVVGGGGCSSSTF